MRGPGQVGLLIVVAIAAPVFVGAGYAALAGAGIVGWAGGEAGLGRFVGVLGEPAVWRGVAFTAWVAIATTALATIAAVLVATTFRSSTPGDRLARALTLVPLPVPHLVAAVTGLLLLGQSGLIARAGHAVGLVPLPSSMPALVYDRAGIGLILTLAWKEFSFLALLAFAIIAGRGVGLEETARTLGAPPGQVLRRVTWPLLWRGLAPGVAAVLAFVAGTYEATALLAPSDPLALPLLTYERYVDPALQRHADAFVLVFLGLAVGAAAAALHELARGRWEAFEA